MKYSASSSFVRYSSSRYPNLLLAAGYNLTVHNRSRGPVEELASMGAFPARSPRKVAERS
jgi:3-hydroxyisobutyrate dehydrogenase-like beta-hydroxyacid dehydrogenase